MKIAYSLATAIVSACLLLAAATPLLAQDKGSALRNNWGRSFESAKFHQIINKDAAGPEKVEGLDGRAAQRVMRQYRESFGKEAGDTYDGSSGTSSGKALN